MNATGDGYEKYGSSVVLAPGEAAFVQYDCAGTIYYYSEILDGVESLGETAILPLVPRHDVSLHQDANYVELADDGTDNSTVITGLHGDLTNIMLAGRTISNSGWNTLCLPFYMSADDIASSPLAGADIRTLNSASVTGNHVSLTFAAEQVIFPGVPYVVRLENSESITDPIFKGVTVNSGLNNFTSSDGHVEFNGYYDAFTVSPEDNPLIYYLTANNQLKYTTKERQLMACRAFFVFTRNDGDGANDFTFSIDFGNGEDAITNVSADGDMSDEWYAIDGRRINGTPKTKGVYVNKGRKVVIK